MFYSFYSSTSTHEQTRPCAGLWVVDGPRWVFGALIQFKKCHLSFGLKFFTYLSYGYIVSFCKLLFVNYFVKLYNNLSLNSFIVTCANTLLVMRGRRQRPKEIIFLIFFISEIAYYHQLCFFTSYLRR